MVPTLTSKWNTYERKNDGIYVINLKRTWEKLLQVAFAIVAIENPADVSALSCRNTGQLAVPKFAATSGAAPIAVHFTPGTFTSQIQAAFCNQDFWWLLIPGLTTSFSQRGLTLTCLPLLCVTQTPLCATWILPSLATRREPIQCVWCGGCWPQKFCTCMTPFPMNTHERS